jgi:hypothetical protein
MNRQVTRLEQMKLGMVAELDCGHYIGASQYHLELKCSACGQHTIRVDGRSIGGCQCGARAFRHVRSWDQPTVEVGQVVECRECEQDLETIAKIQAAVDDGSYHHARAVANGAGRLTGQVAAYRYDPTSPSCFRLIATLSDGVLARAYADQLRAVLSPTERA